MSPIDITKLIDEGCSLAESGDHSAAIELFREAISLGEAWVGLNLGNSLLAVGDVDAALEAFAAAWASGYDPAGFNLARQLEAQGDLDEARGVYRSLIQNGYAKAMIQEADFLREEGDYRGFIELIKTAMDDPSPTGDLAAGILGNEQWSGRGTVEALLRRGADAYPSARADLGALLIADERLDEGISILQQGANLDETESILPLANWHAEKGDFDVARGLYRQGFALGDAHAAFNLGAMLWANDRRKSARKWIRRAADAGDLRAKAWINGEVERKKKDPGNH